MITKSKGFDRKYLDIRKWYNCKDDKGDLKWFPTKKGIFIPEESIREMILQLQIQILSLTDRRALRMKRKNQTLKKLQISLQIISINLISIHS